MLNLKLLWSLFGPRLAYPTLFGLSGGGGKEKSKFNEKTETEVDKRKTGTTTQVTDKTATDESTSAATDTSSQTTSGQQTLSTLDQETQDLLSGLLGDLAEGGGSADIVAALNERGLNAEESLQGLVDPIVANARENLETQAGQAVQGFARSAGSSQNTLVAQLGLEEAANVEREVADLSATLGLQVNQVTTEQLQAGLGNTETLVGQLADILKGSTQTGTSSESTDVVRQLEELVSSIQTEKGTATETEDLRETIRALEKAKGKGQTRGASAGFSLGI